MASELGITCADFCNNELGRIQLELRPARFPPIPCDLLVSGDEEIPGSDAQPR